MPSGAIIMCIGHSKEIRADVEKLDAILKQAKLPMMEKAGNE